MAEVPFGKKAVLPLLNNLPALEDTTLVVLQKAFRLKSKRKAFKLTVVVSMYPPEVAAPAVLQVQAISRPHVGPPEVVVAQLRRPALGYDVAHGAALAAPGHDAGLAQRPDGAEAAEAVVRGQAHPAGEPHDGVGVRGGVSEGAPRKLVGVRQADHVLGAERVWWHPGAVRRWCRAQHFRGHALPDSPGSCDNPVVGRGQLQGAAQVFEGPQRLAQHLLRQPTPVQCLYTELQRVRRIACQVLKRCGRVLHDHLPLLPLLPRMGAVAQQCRAQRAVWAVVRQPVQRGRVMCICFLEASGKDCVVPSGLGGLAVHEKQIMLDCARHGEHTATIAGRDTALY
mmetsp:Transcript_81468/g.230859  ORF Transcript_81468/g.230859 Transcript_81468/m.230859 type:complete len:340 (-) Transcript_81468:52-1071(-)